MNDRHDSGQQFIPGGGLVLSAAPPNGNGAPPVPPLAPTTGAVPAPRAGVPSFEEFHADYAARYGAQAAAGQPGTPFAPPTAQVAPTVFTPPGQPAPFPTVAVPPPMQMQAAPPAAVQVAQPPMPMQLPPQGPTALAPGYVFVPGIGYMTEAQWQAMAAAHAQQQAQVAPAAPAAPQAPAPGPTPGQGPTPAWNPQAFAPPPQPQAQAPAPVAAPPSAPPAQAAPVVAQPAATPQTAPEPPKRGRGRPAGSRNRAPARPTGVDAPTASPQQLNLEAREELAEAAIADEVALAREIFVNEARAGRITIENARGAAEYALALATAFYGVVAPS